MTTPKREELVAQALAAFTEYFVKNYPGPNTIISDPNWHAPKIFRAAQYALSSLLSGDQEPVANVVSRYQAGNRKWEIICEAAVELPRGMKLYAAPVDRPEPAQPETVYSTRDGKAPEGYWPRSLDEPAQPTNAEIDWAQQYHGANMIRVPQEPVQPVAQPAAEWHEDMGDVLWWRFPVMEPPYCGQPHDDDFEGSDGKPYYTHWTPLVVPTVPEANRG